MIQRKFHDHNCCCGRCFKNDRLSKCECNYSCECCEFFQINLAGLMDNLNFKLIKNRGRSLEIFTFGGYRTRGKSHDVGIDYVDIRREEGQLVTILKDKIDHIRWNSHNCK